MGSDPKVVAETDVSCDPKGGAMKLRASVVGLLFLTVSALALAQETTVSLIRNNSITSVNPVTPPMSSLFDVNTGELLGQEIPQESGPLLYEENIAMPGDGLLVLYQVRSPNHELYLSKTQDNHLRLVSSVDITSAEFIASTAHGPDSGTTHQWLLAHGLSANGAVKLRASDGSLAYYAQYTSPYCDLDYVYNETWPFGTLPTLLLADGADALLVSPEVGGIRFSNSTHQATVVSAEQAALLIAKRCSAPGASPNSLSAVDPCYEANAERLRDCIAGAMDGVSLFNCGVCVVGVAACAPLGPALGVACLAAFESEMGFPDGPGGPCLGCLQAMLEGAINGCDPEQTILCDHPDPCVTEARCFDGFCTELEQCGVPPNSPPCTTNGICTPGVGCHYPPPDCDDRDPCTLDSCDGVLCLHQPLCNDGNACTNDTCLPGGICQFVPLSCDDGNECTIDSLCDPSTGCHHTAVSCDDHDACTVDSCDPSTGCRNLLVSCDDGDRCTIDSCDPETGCQNLLNSCDDDNPCTTDFCDASAGCVHLGCNDGNACTLDFCRSWGCDHVWNCDDGQSCTIDTCDPATGCINTPRCEHAWQCCGEACCGMTPAQQPIACCNVGGVPTCSACGSVCCP